MGKFDKYDVIMVILEIIAHDTGRDYVTTSKEQGQNIINVIGKIEGDVSLRQILREEITMDIGDKFENISQSIIATRKSIAAGVIKIRKVQEHDLADALEKLEKAINDTTTSEMSERSRQDAFHLLSELTKQASSPTRAKAILRTLGRGLWEAIKNVDSISKTAVLVWPMIERLWS